MKPKPTIYCPILLRYYRLSWGQNCPSKKELKRYALNIGTFIFILFFVMPHFSYGQNPTKKTFNLDGDWHLTGISPDQKDTLRLNGTVPGQVHPDLMKAGMIPDPFWRKQAEKSQWVENWEWRYKRDFQLPKNFKSNWMVFQFDGLDTFATLFLNGKKIGSSNDMFIPYAFEINKNQLKKGKNTIEVRFTPPLEAVKDKPYAKYPAIFDPTNARVYIRRMQAAFGWDWLNRLVSAGIWRSCRIVAYDKVKIDHLFMYTKKLNKKSANIKIRVETSYKQKSSSKLELSLTSPQGKQVWHKTANLSDTITKLDFSLKNPKLWWPNGLGKHPLYHLTAIVKDKKGNKLDQKTVETGIRTVTVQELPDKKGSSFTIVVNGVKVFAKGANWVPADPFPSRITPEKYDRLIGQAEAAGMNILRSWGGGIYEPAAFWHACNKKGIMITQDLLLADAVYPGDDPEFVDLLQDEFTKATKIIRNNPSLILYAGDNELGAGSHPDADWSMKKMQIRRTAPLFKKLDPSRVFRITSPYGGDPNNSVLAGDNHTNAEFTDELRSGNMRNYRAVIDTVCSARFMSEHAAAGAPPKRTLLKFMTQQDLKGNAMWEYHTKDNPSAPPGHLTLFQVVKRSAKLLYGDPGSNIDRRIQQMEYVQYDFVRLALEASRRRKFYTSGIQFWMFNDCWPASGWSLVDYYGFRKAGWYAAAAGDRPVIAASQKDGKTLKWWLCNDLLHPVQVNVQLKIQPTTGAPRWEKNIKVTVPANKSIKAFEMDLKKFNKKLVMTL